MKHPHAIITLWDNYKREFFELRSEDGELGPQLDKDMEVFARSKGSRILQRSSDSGGRRFLAMTCACEKSGSTTEIIMSHNCLFVPPITYYDGWESYRAIGFRAEDVSDMFSEFDRKGQLQVTSKKKMETNSLQQLFLISLPDLFSSLTDRQLKALVTSVELGYYQNPREISTGKMAKTMKVPRTTLQEHRRKAESKLMSALAPYLLTYSRTGARIPAERRAGTTISQMTV